MSPSFNSAISIAWNGIQRDLRGIQENAQQIASSVTGPRDIVDVAEPLADIQRHRQAIEASARLIGRLDETLGTIIDRLA